MDRFDVALTPYKSGDGRDGSLVVRFPMSIGRALREAGYNRAELTVTPDGLLVRPYVGIKGQQNGSVALPDWTQRP